MAQLRNTGNTVRFQSSKQLRKPTVHKTGVSGFNFRREINIFLKYFPQFRLFISYNSFLQLLLYHFYMNFCQGLFHAGFFNTGLFIFFIFFILYRVWIKRFSSNLPFPNSMAFVYTYHVGTGYGKKQCCGAGSSWSDPV